MEFRSQDPGVGCAHCYWALSVGTALFSGISLNFKKNKTCKTLSYHLLNTPYLWVILGRVPNPAAPRKQIAYNPWKVLEHTVRHLLQPYDPTYSCSHSLITRLHTSSGFNIKEAFGYYKPVRHQKEQKTNQKFQTGGVSQKASGSQFWLNKGQSLYNRYQKPHEKQGNKGHVFHRKITSWKYEDSMLLCRFMKETEFLIALWASAPIMEGIALPKASRQHLPRTCYYYTLCIW